MQYHYATIGQGIEGYISTRSSTAPDGKIKMESAPPINIDWIANSDGSYSEAEKTSEELQEIETAWRDLELKETDAFGLDDYPDNDLRASMRTYRQELRDYPDVDGFGDSSLRPVDPRS